MKQFLKNQVKKISRTFGFEITRKNIYRATKAGFLQHISRLGFRPQTVIDVGAAFGTFELYETYPDATHLLIEPLEEFGDALKAITQKYKAQYVLAVAGAKSGSTVINVHPDLVGSSSLKETEGIRADGIPREVLVVTIDDICHEKNLKRPYLLKVDVQGAELDVLEGAKKVLKNSELVILEVSLFKFMVNGPQFYDVVSYMKDRSYVVYDIIDHLYRPLDGALGCVDLAFVKENGQFRKEHFYATREQRKQMFTRATRTLISKK